MTLTHDIHAALKVTGKCENISINIYIHLQMTCKKKKKKIKWKYFVWNIVFNIQENILSVGKDFNGKVVKHL